MLVMLQTDAGRMLAQSKSKLPPVGSLDQLCNLTPMDVYRIDSVTMIQRVQGINFTVTPLRHCRFLT
jgi:hypothetical protein